MVQNGKISREQETAVLTLIAGLGGSEPLRLVFERMLGADLDSPRQSSLLSALTQAAQQRGVRPSGDLTGIADLLAAHGESEHVSAIRLIGLWRVESLRARLAELVFEVQEQLSELRDSREHNDPAVRDFAIAMTATRARLQGLMDELQAELVENFAAFDSGSEQDELFAELKEILSKIAYMRTLLRDVDRELDNAKPE